MMEELQQSNNLDSLPHTRIFVSSQTVDVNCLSEAEVVEAYKNLLWKEVEWVR